MLSPDPSVVWLVCDWIESVLICEWIRTQLFIDLQLFHCDMSLLTRDPQLMADYSDDKKFYEGA